MTKNTYKLYSIVAINAALKMEGWKGKMVESVPFKETDNGMKVAAKATTSKNGDASMQAFRLVVEK